MFYISIKTSSDLWDSLLKSTNLQGRINIVLCKLFHKIKMKEHCQTSSKRLMLSCCQNQTKELERSLSCWESFLLFQRTATWFPVPTHTSSQLSVTPALGDPKALAPEGTSMPVSIHVHTCMDAHMHAGTYTQLIKSKISNLIDKHTQMNRKL